jgi:hypothetical protein
MCLGIRKILPVFSANTSPFDSWALKTNEEKMKSWKLSIFTLLGFIFCGTTIAFLFNADVRGAIESKIIHDKTLKGDGTSSSPLGIAGDAPQVGDIPVYTSKGGIEWGSPGRGGGLNGLKEYLQTTTLVIPAGVTHIMVELWGAGGGGGGGGNATILGTAGGSGGSGGGGAYVRGVAQVTPGETITIVIGKGGIGGSIGVDGDNGGDTKIISSNGTVLLFAGGGGGGKAGLSNSDCSIQSGGTAGLAGQADPRAGIQRVGSVGTNGQNAHTINSDTCGHICGGGERRSTIGVPTVGTMTPPGSRGGASGEGSIMSITCTFAGDPSFPGTDGYAIVTW